VKAKLVKANVTEKGSKASNNCEMCFPRCQIQHRRWASRSLSRADVHDIAMHLLFVTASIAYWVVVGTMLERAFTARTRRHVGQPSWQLDAVFVVLQYTLWLPLFSWVISSLQPHVHVVVCPQSVPAWVVVGVLMLVLGDVCAFALHVLMHRVPLLWRFHRVHHTSTEMDWMAAHREHPVDGLLTMAAMNLPLLVVEYPVRFLVPVFLLRGAWAVFVHCNVTIDGVVFQFVGLLCGDPVLHRAHHAIVAPGEATRNYGNLAPYLDVLFGTHHRPIDDSYPLGCDGADAKTYLQQLRLD
jgi:sterol desaturase/sphingolipid hydroxylase (fatty acid hydroxylase superfamily)